MCFDLTNALLFCLLFCLLTQLQLHLREHKLMQKRILFFFDLMSESLHASHEFVLVQEVAAKAVRRVFVMGFADGEVGLGEGGF